MNRMPLSLLLTTLCAVPAAGGAMASTHTVVGVELGSKRGEMKFFPEVTRLRKGKSCKLILHNASPVMHEFDAPRLAKFVRSEKVEVKDAKGQLVAEIHGTAPKEIEVAPAATVEWHIVAIRAAGRLTVVCGLPGHRAAGMVGAVCIE